MTDAPRAITLWQPWASLIALHLKRFETRSWAPTYRGPLLIHAGKGIDRAFTAELLNEGILDEELPQSAILCAVDLMECYRTDGLMLPADLPPNERRYGDYSPGRWAWQLGNLRVLPEPVEAKGALGLWLPDSETMAAVNRGLEAA